MQILQPPGAMLILAIAAHPDDIESWCAGTLAQAIDTGATVQLLLVTSGEHGSNDPQITPAAVARQREHEARTAAERLGIAEVAFLRYGDGEVEGSRALLSGKSPDLAAERTFASSLWPSPAAWLLALDRHPRYRRLHAPL